MRLCGILTALAAMAALLPSAALAVDTSLIRGGKPPKSLSEFGFFADNAGRRPAEGVVPYALNTPLFTDYALKERYVYVPTGTIAAYQDEDAFVFPQGAALIKSFGYPADMREPDTDFRLIETRVLLNTDQGWKGYAYVWNADQTDAVLKIAGYKTNVSWTHTDGSTKTSRYVVPNVNQCKGCHIVGKEMSPIGPKARHLNRNYDYQEGTDNQLTYWSAIGYLSGAPAPDKAPRLPRFDDASDGSLSERARAYLDINCSHCHSPAGPANTSGLYLESFTADPSQWGLWKRPVAAGRGSGGLDFAIHPGKPDQSIVALRMGSSDPGVMMPELGRSMVHTEGLDLIREWIAALKD